MKLFISPHNDDEALFGAYTLMREKPLVVIMTDSWIQPGRGETGCSADERWKESVAGCSVLGCPVIRMGLRDDTLTEDDIRRTLGQFGGFDGIYAPAVQGGNRQHDMIGRVAKEIWPECKQYTTYTKTELWTQGSIEMIPTEEEKERKIRALECYQSQLRINRPHFDAVVNKSEWLN